MLNDSKVRIPQQPALLRGRVLVWFSCGAASACAAKLTLEQYPDAEILYCDTLAYEHPDNRRFIADVEKWIGKEIKILKSEKYQDIFDVFDKTGWLVGVSGARCTQELKRNVRKQYQGVGDVHVFGFGVGYRDWEKGKLVVMVYPIDKWVLMLLKTILGEHGEVRNLGDVRWLATEDRSAGKGTGRHIAMFVLRPKDWKPCR